MSTTTKASKRRDRNDYPMTDAERRRHEPALARVTHGDPAELPSLNELAAGVGMSLFHFHRRFKLAFGVTPKLLAAGRQIAEAKRLMLAGVPLREVAARTGFASHSHFCMRFRQLEGETPTRWIWQQARNQNEKPRRVRLSK